MAILATAIGTVDIYDESTSLLRGLTLFLIVFLIAVLWVLLRRRWAPRTIENWRGTGIHTGLSPLQAALLMRTHPGVLVAMALESRFASGEVRLTALNPLTIEWADRDPKGPVEEALSRAVDEKGRFDLDGVDAFLDALYTDVNDAMIHHSGRQTAVALRKRIADLWEAALTDNSLEPEDRLWLMIREPEKIIDRIGPGETGEMLHDIIRFCGVFRAHLLSGQRSAERAYRARSGYYRYRKDLSVVRTAVGDPFYRDDDEANRSPFERKLHALAGSLDGQVTYTDQALPLRFARLWNMREADPSVAGRYHGRPVGVTLSLRGEAEIEIAASAGRLFQIVPIGGTVEVKSLYEDGLDSADRSFSRAYRACHLDCSEMESWLNTPGLQHAIADLMPFIELQGRERMLWMRIHYDRDMFTVKSIRDRFAPLLALAENLERHASTTAPHDPD